MTELLERVGQPTPEAPLSDEINIGLEWVGVGTTGYWINRDFSDGEVRLVFPPGHLRPNLLQLYDALDAQDEVWKEANARVIACEVLSLGNDTDYSRLEALYAERQAIGAVVHELKLEIAMAGD
ncbi:MAG TPA: hypothetical protein VFB03_00945 [Candidatus Saccharimonadales bacterium]|nr:hypothetical protein [Candidatus Saccharimonadales bacterium]